MVTANTGASVDGSQLDFASQVGLSANTSGNITAVGISGAVAGKVGIAGQVSLNTIADTTDTHIGVALRLRPMGRSRSTRRTVLRSTPMAVAWPSRLAGSSRRNRYDRAGRGRVGGDQSGQRYRQGPGRKRFQSGWQQHRPGGDRQSFDPGLVDRRRGGGRKQPRWRGRGQHSAGLYPKTSSPTT